jgi:hypothetical protein
MTPRQRAVRGRRRDIPGRSGASGGFLLAGPVWRGGGPLPARLSASVSVALRPGVLVRSDRWITLLDPPVRWSEAELNPAADVRAARRLRGVQRAVVGGVNGADQDPFLIG